MKKRLLFVKYLILKIHHWLPPHNNAIIGGQGGFIDTELFNFFRHVNLDFACVHSSTCVCVSEFGAQGKQAHCQIYVQLWNAII